jgi:hypothetical protein
VNATTKTAQIRLSRSSPAYWRITFDNPPLNVMGPQFVQEFREIMTAIEDDEQVKVVVFDSAVEGFFLNHSDFLANFEDLKRIPPGPTGLEAWPDILVRLTRAPVVSIASIRGRATGNGSEIALACDNDFRQSGKGRALAVGSGRRPGSRRRTHGAAAAADGPRTRAGGATQLRRYWGRAGPSLWICEPGAAGRRARRVRRRACDSHRRVRQVGDRQHQAPGERQSAARRGNRGRVGRLHGLGCPAGRTGRG